MDRLKPQYVAGLPPKLGLTWDLDLEAYQQLMEKPLLWWTRSALLDLELSLSAPLRRRKCRAQLPSGQNAPRVDRDHTPGGAEARPVERIFPG